MDIHHIAAFSEDNKGGNPAGVTLLDDAISESEMAQIAATLGYSETVFAFPLSNSKRHWRVRYFSPESEVPFCGHASIALGAVLGDRYGLGDFTFKINNAEIKLNACAHQQALTVELQSPQTSSRSLNKAALNDTLNLFNLHQSDLDEQLPPAFIHGGSDHILLVLNRRQTLSQMNYDLILGRQLMHAYGIVTIMLVYIENTQTFHCRNAFASGGVLEDPATGAAAAAFAGYLRDRQWPHGGHISILQGQDMGIPCRISVSLSPHANAPVFVKGTIRKMK